MKLADKKHCCGCAGCSTVCPFNAIKMEYDEEYFLYPVIDEALCRDCGKCEKVCPILNASKIKIDTHNREVAQGFFKDIEKHKASASGGAATALAEIILARDGCVFGSTYYDDYKKAKYIKAETIEELCMLKGSKYIETEKNDIFESVQEELKSGRQVLFTGLPCDVAGVKAYLGKEYDNLYACELICHGPTSQKIQEEYVNRLSKKYKSRVVNFSSRYKIENNDKPYIKVDFENKKSYIRPLWDTEYGYAFAKYNRESCYHCSFKGENRVADISIGDSWCEKKDKDDKRGLSIIYAHTDKGIELLKCIEDMHEFVTEKLDYMQIKNDNPAIRESVRRPLERDKFSEQLRRHELKKAAACSMKFKQRLKFKMKCFIKGAAR